MNDGGDNQEIFDERRQRIFDALYERSPVLAGVYRTAIRQLVTPTVNGDERARASVIGHTMRELMNTLPSVLGEGTRRLEGTPSTALLLELANLASQFPDMDLQQALAYVPVPSDFAIAVSELIQRVSQETVNIRDGVAELLAEGSSSDHPAVGQWMSAQRFFLGLTHLSHPPGENADVKSDEEIEANIRIVEDLIDTRTAAFFDTRHSLDDLIGNINAPAEPAQ